MQSEDQGERNKKEYRQISLSLVNLAEVLENALRSTPLQTHFEIKIRLTHYKIEVLVILSISYPLVILSISYRLTVAPRF